MTRLVSSIDKTQGTLPWVLFYPGVEEVQASSLTNRETLERVGYWSVPGGNAGTLQSLIHPRRSGRKRRADVTMEADA